ncbi:hypothetical protein HDU76_011904, partial [Blyttiomyces sp. JEL0837]
MSVDYIHHRQVFEYWGRVGPLLDSQNATNDVQTIDHKNAVDIDNDKILRDS